MKDEILSLDNPPIMQTSEQAVPIPRVFGRVRVAGQVIWADEFKLLATATKKGNQPATGFSLSFAIALCEGEIDHISKIWVNDKLLNMDTVIWRFYKGSATQNADPLLENAFGVGNAPTFRDVAYVVFEDLLLEPFGNMVPKFSFEVVNAIGVLEKQVKAVSIIPGATEFGYHTVSIICGNNYEYSTENEHGFLGQTDFVTSIDELCNLCPNLEKVSLIVPWFGDDLRASDIKVKPCVDNLQKNTTPEVWRVNGITRAQAKQVSQINGRAAFGGTPSDNSVLAAIAEFKARGLEVVFYPFILMDVPADNILSDPYGGANQASFPWRGRITCDPAIGQAGSPDQTGVATTQVKQFFGAALVNNFVSNGGYVFYTGGVDWGYRRMILHYAKLCELAGGVDGFLLGSELVGLTKIRSSKTDFPAVDELISLANDVKAILPLTQLSYGADWSEYFGYQPSDGTGDVLFHLDDLWADGNIDFVGIDAYWPLSDWRDGVSHLDKDLGAQSIYDRDYLRGNIRGGEGFDYYYASANDRDAQNRLVIEDGAYSKDWVFKIKDIKSWWSNLHYNRINGVEVATPTAWVAQSKPIWLTEIGCPAVDKGSNQPNVFYDPLSSEGKLPYFANKNRDDVMQRRYLEVLLGFYEGDNADNPTSIIYGGKMVEARNAFIWAFDARPYPLFPLLTEVWSDGENWNYGHWLNGRLGAVPLDRLILQWVGNIKCDVSAINGQIDGYWIEQSLSPQKIVLDIIEHFALVAFIRDDILVFRHRNNSEFIGFDEGQLLVNEQAMVKVEAFAGLPTDIHIKYIADDGSYSTKVSSELVDLDLLKDDFRNVVQYALPAVLSKELAAKLASNRLLLMRGRDRGVLVSIAVPLVALECGDVFELGVEYEKDGLNGKWEIIAISHDNGLLIEAVSADINIVSETIMEDMAKQGKSTQKTPQGKALVIAMDLPILDGIAEPLNLSLAAFVKPWVGQISVFEDVGGSFVKRLDVSERAVIGQAVWDVNLAVIGRYDRASRLSVIMNAGVLSSVSNAELLAGKNLAAIENSNGDWEIIQFRDAVLTGVNQYELSHFIRGKFGSKYAIEQSLLAAAQFVMVDEKISKFALTSDEILSDIAVKFGPADKVIEDEAYQSATWQHRAVALQPFAPVHVKALKDGDDIIISWIRQTRFGGENWALNQVALNEQVESYELEIFAINSAVVVRDIGVNSSFVAYTAAQQISDFGGLISGFKIKVYQMSAQVGRGKAEEVIIYV